MCVDLRDVFGGSGPRSIRDAVIPSSLRVLVLAPHPDDFDAIGLTLRLFSENGNPIDVAVVRTGGGVDDSYSPGATPAAKARLREREQRISLRLFGLPDERVTFFDLDNDANDQPVDLPVNRDRLSTFVLAKRPDIVLLPHGNDTNSGHRAMYSMFRHIAEQVDYPLAGFLNRDPKTIRMRVDLYTAFSREEAEWKACLLRCHDSQHQRNLNTRGYGFDDRILNMNRQIARELSLDAEHAEAFELEFYRRIR